MQYDKLKKRPVQFLSVTGLEVAEFNYLLPYFREHWDAYMRCYTLEGKPRLRQSYPRKDSVLPNVADKLIFLLIYLKTNPIQEHHAASFGMTQSQANIRIHLYCDSLRKALKTLGELPERNEYRLSRILSALKDVLLDATERPIERPSQSDRQKSCYSGKKNS